MDNQEQEVLPREEDRNYLTWAELQEIIDGLDHKIEQQEVNPNNNPQNNK